MSSNLFEECDRCQSDLSCESTFVVLSVPVKGKDEARDEVICACCADDSRDCGENVVPFSDWW